MLASRESTHALKIWMTYRSSWSSWWRHIVDISGVLWRIYYSILQPIWWALVSTFQINLSPMFFFSRRDASVVLATCPDILWHSLLWPCTWFFSIRGKNHFFLQILRDKKLKFEAQLSLIGGTMGLLTGFSVISAVEIFFFLVNLVMKSVPFKHTEKCAWILEHRGFSDFCLPCKTRHIPGIYKYVQDVPEKFPLEFIYNWTKIRTD